VAEVGVHLDDHRRAGGERHPEPIEICPTESLLEGTMADVDARIGGRQRVREATGPVGGLVVDHEQGGPGEALEDASCDRAEILGLVVGRQDDPGTGAGRARRWCADRSLGRGRVGHRWPV